MYSERQLHNFALHQIVIRRVISWPDKLDGTCSTHLNSRNDAMWTHSEKHRIPVSIFRVEGLGIVL